MRILVSLDGSEKDQRALAVAVSFAERTDANIHLVRVVPQPTTKTSLGVAMAGLTGARAELRADAERNLRNMKERVSAMVRGRITWMILDASDIAAELLRQAGDGTDMIVMATRAPGSIGRAFLGSVAANVLRSSSIPVLLVPPAYGTDDRVVRQ